MTDFLIGVSLGLTLGALSVATGWALVELRDWLDDAFDVDMSDLGDREVER